MAESNCCLHYIAGARHELQRTAISPNFGVEIVEKSGVLTFLNGLSTAFPWFAVSRDLQIKGERR
jgi:hypothetical protein